MKKVTNLKQVLKNWQYSFSYRRFHGLFNGVPCQFLSTAEKSYTQNQKYSFFEKMANSRRHIIE